MSVGKTISDLYNKLPDDASILEAFKWLAASAVRSFGHAGVSETCCGGHYLAGVPSEPQGQPQQSVSSGGAPTVRG